MYYRIIWGILFVVAFWHASNGQDCTITLKGIITDESTKVPLKFANILITENQKGNTTDKNGVFLITELCPGAYHIQVSHIGCESQKLFIHLLRDTFLNIRLHHHTELLNEISVHSSHEQTTVQSVQSVQKEIIIKNASKNLSDILEKINGVSTIKNGSGISKPVVHGMYGNRITVLNNGIVQAGQQWGNDHAPEIDPFMADHISVVKGAASLANGGNGLGSLVHIETGTVDEDPHIHGLVNYIYQLNGRAHTINGKFQKHSDQLSWKISGTIKKAGDTKAPDYFLTNTGKSEFNLNTFFTKKFNTKLSSTLLLSTFNTEIGILRGSHVGNSTDLINAFDRPVPFFTRDTFSYSITAPKQKVNHHLVKLENKYQFSDRLIYTLTLASQLNHRKEFDVRRSGRTDIPALELKQYLYTIDGKIHKEISEALHFKTGMQLNITDNTNDPETGILPLIPDYLSYRTGAYFILEKNTNKYTIEGGIRSDLNVLNGARIIKSLPLSLERFNHNFLIINAAGGIKYFLNESSNVAFNTGLSMRPPEINELYSNGLHQGVSGIEEGLSSLRQEKSIKSLIEIESKLSSTFFIQAIAYHQYIKDYIYLKPEKELRLTIRGAFPVYKYAQTNASLSGLDLLTSVEINENLKWISRYAFIYARDLNNNTGLIFIPANNMHHELEWSIKNSKRFRNNSFSIGAKYILSQKNVNEDQDFLAPPKGYTLFDLQANTDIFLAKNQLKFSIGLENIFDTSYRDYLNRLRYFADELGRQVSIRVAYEF